nr:hypothetical protein [Nocardia macrotermitis]
MATDVDNADTRNLVRGFTGQQQFPLIRECAPLPQPYTVGSLRQIEFHSIPEWVVVDRGRIGTQRQGQITTLELRTTDETNRIPVSERLAVTSGHEADVVQSTYRLHRFGQLMRECCIHLADLAIEQFDGRPFTEIVVQEMVLPGVVEDLLETRFAADRTEQRTHRQHSLLRCGILVHQHPQQFTPSGGHSTVIQRGQRMIGGGVFLQAFEMLSHILASSQEGIGIRVLGVAMHLSLLIFRQVVIDMSQTVLAVVPSGLVRVEASISVTYISRFMRRK